MRHSQVLSGTVAMALAVSLSAVGVPSPAGAATYAPTNPKNIGIDPNTKGHADPYPSTIQAYGLGTLVSDVNVTINKLSHTHPDDLDIELVGPNGAAVPLMSDACGSDSGADGPHRVTLTFDDSAAASLPDNGNNGCPDGTYRPTNYVGNDGVNDEWHITPTASTLAAFNGINPNGPWQLYVDDDDGTTGTGGMISNGWTLTINTRQTPAVTIPGPTSTDGRGPAAPYPFPVQVPGPSRLATDVDVVLPGLTHAVPGSLQVLVVAPNGTSVVVMAGACGQTPLNDVTLVFDDSAEDKLSAGAGTCSSGTRKPTVQDTVSSFPAPAPPGPYGTKLSDFRGVRAAGTWQIYVNDTRIEDGGYIASPPMLRVKTDNKPPVTKVTKRPKSSERAWAKIKFASNEDGSKFQCRVDKRHWKHCRSPLKLTHLKVGKHRVKIRAIDESGNIDPTPVEVTWRVKPRH